MQKLNKILIHKMMIVGLSSGLTIPAVADLGIVNTLMNKGFATTQATLGYMYSTGDDISQDDVKAFEWTKAAANRGRAFSQYTLGKMYSNGHWCTSKRR